MSITINDGLSEKGAMNALLSLKEIDHLMVKINLMLGAIEQECDVDISLIKQAHDELETTSNMAYAEIQGAIAEYNSEGEA